MVIAIARLIDNRDGGGSGGGDGSDSGDGGNRVVMVPLHSSERENLIEWVFFSSRTLASKIFETADVRADLHLSRSILPIIVSTSEHAKNRRRIRKCTTWFVLSNNFAAIVRTHPAICDFSFFTANSFAEIPIKEVFIFFPRRSCPKTYCDLFILPTQLKFLCFNPKIIGESITNYRGELCRGDLKWNIRIRHNCKVSIAESILFVFKIWPYIKGYIKYNPMIEF